MLHVDWAIEHFRKWLASIIAVKADRIEQLIKSVQQSTLTRSVTSYQLWLKTSKEVYGYDITLHMPLAKHNYLRQGEQSEY